LVVENKNRTKISVNMENKITLKPKLYDKNYIKARIIIDLKTSYSHHFLTF